MPDMMLTEARFGMGRVVTQTFGVIRRNVVPIFLLCCIVYVAQTGVSYVLGRAAIKLIVGRQAWSTALPSMFIDQALRALLLGSVIYIAVEDLDSRRARLGPAILFGVQMTIPVLLMTLLINLGFIVGSLLIVTGMMLMLRWFVAVPVRIIEGPGFRRVLSRSAALTKGHRWKLFGLSVSYGVLVIVLSLPSAQLTGVFAGKTTPLAGFNPGLYLMTMVLSVVASAISAVGTATIYGELRRVKEGGLPNQLAAVFE